MTEPLLTTVDVADRLKVSPTTVKRLRARGELDPFERAVVLAIQEAIRLRREAKMRGVSKAA